MASSIDASQPAAGTPTTASVRANFAAAKAEIEALQSGKLDASGVSSFGATLIDDADASAARTTLGLGTAATTNATAYATAAQGAKADTAVQPNTSPTLTTLTATTVNAALNGTLGATTPAAATVTTLTATTSVTAPTVTSGGTGAVSVQTSGGTQLSIAHTASATSCLEATGSAVNYPFLRAKGAVATVGMAFETKGPGGDYQFYAASAMQFRILPAASAVNYAQVTGAATGGAPTISAQGSDSNIDLSLTPKGTGNVRFGTHTATADTAISGYIEIKDASGTVRKLAVIA